VSVGRYHCPNCDTVVTRPHLCPALTTNPEEAKSADPQATVPERPTGTDVIDDEARQRFHDLFPNRIQ
jgi:hypothetical protein